MSSILLIHGILNLLYIYIATQKRPMTIPPKYTCIQIFSYNECNVIENTIVSVKNQDIIKRYYDKFKIQLFDGGSTDCTIDIAKKYGLEVYVLGRGKLRARNYSVAKFPECKIHVHLDSDIILPDYWLRNVLYWFKYNDVVAVTTPRLYYNIVLSSIIIPFRGFFNLEERLFGSNSAIRYDVFINNLFDTRYDGKENMVIEEEYNFYKRLSRYGRIILEKTPAVTRFVTKKYLLSLQ